MNSKACLKLIHNNNFNEKEECIFEKSTKLDLNPFIEEERNYFPKLDKSVVYHHSCIKKTRALNLS